MYGLQCYHLCEPFALCVHALKSFRHQSQCLDPPSLPAVISSMQLSEKISVMAITVSDLLQQ